MNTAREIQKYKAAKFAKKATKTVLAQGVKLAGGVVGGINPVSAGTHYKAMRSTDRHIEAIERLYRDAHLSVLTYKAEIYQTLQYILAQKRAKRTRYKQNMVPIVSGLVGVRSAAHHLRKRYRGEQGEERRLHARRLWRFANGEQVTTDKKNKRAETRLAIAVVSELVGPDRVDWVLRTRSGFDTVIFDKLART